MYGVVRQWRADVATLQDFVQRIQSALPEVEAIPGFVSYDAVLSGNTLITVSVYQDQAGADAWIALAQRYVLEQWTDLNLGTPQVTNGEVVLHRTT